MFKNRRQARRSCSLKCRRETIRCRWILLLKLWRCIENQSENRNAGMARRDYFYDPPGTTSRFDFGAARAYEKRASFKRHEDSSAIGALTTAAVARASTIVSHSDPDQLCTQATILPRTCPSASRSNAFGIASNVICSATVGLILPACTNVISSLAIRLKSSCRRRKAGEARTPPKTEIVN